MSRQSVRQRRAFHATRPPVVPPHYQHREATGWPVLGVVVLLLLVSALAGALS